MKTVFNEKNTGHITKSYPMFLGDSLGLVDTVNVVNEMVNDLKEKQRSGKWYPTEISMVQDRTDMDNVESYIVDKMNTVISWQHMTDSIAGRSILALYSPHVTNSQAEAMIAEWGTIEFVHGEAYMHIVKQTRMNPDQVLIDTYNNSDILKRSEKIIEIFDSLYTMPHDLPLREKQKIIAKALCTTLLMEGVSFMASFAVTFAIAERGVFQGIAETVSLIARDELYHTRMSYELIKACKYTDGWLEVFNEIKDEIIEIANSIINSELAFARYLMKDTDLNNLCLEQLEDTIYYFSGMAFKMLELPYNHKEVKSLPVLYMEKYIDRSLLQFAPQELPHGSYRAGTVLDDLSDDLDLDFDI